MCRRHTKEQQSRQGKKGWKVMPTWQFCAISPARLISTMCHHYKYCHLASFCVSSVAKMHAAHSHSPALTWYLHSSVGGALILKNGGHWFISGQVFYIIHMLSGQHCIYWVGFSLQDHHLMKFLGNLCVCEDRPIPSNQSEHMKCLFVYVNICMCVCVCVRERGSLSMCVQQRNYPQQK